MKKIVVKTGFLPGGEYPYKGEYIHKVKSFREGEKGLGEGYPQPEFLDLELNCYCGIKGKMEKEIAITPDTPLDCRNHKYYCLTNDVWIRNLKDDKYVTDWTKEEPWGVAEEVTYDDNGNITGTRELGFVILLSDRKNGIVL